MNGFWFRALLVGLFCMGSIGDANAQQPPAEQEQADGEKKTGEEKASEKKADEEKAGEKKADEKKAAEKKAEPAEEKPTEEPKPVEEKKPEEAPKAAEEPKKAPEAMKKTPEATEAKPEEAPKPEATEAKPEEAPKPEAEAKPEETPKPEEAPKTKAAEAKPPEAPAKKTDVAGQPPAGGATAGGDGAKSNEEGEGTRLGVDGFPLGQTQQKAWRVLANVSGSVGAGFMVANSENRTPSFGWSLGVLGSYTLTQLLEGRLDGFLRLGADQVVADTVTEVAVGQVNQQEFFFRDIRLGLRGANLYTEKLTGISLTGTLEGFLPTSKTAIGSERWFRLGTSAILGKTFANVGPGSIAIQWSTIFRKDFSGRSPTFDVANAPTQFGACRKTSRDIDNVDRCIAAGGRNSDYSFINNLGINYIWGPVTVSASLAIFSTKWFNQAPDELPAGQTRSPFASQNTWSNLTFANISVSYLFLDHWNASIGVSTFQNPYTFSGESNDTLRFPFFDTVTTAQNLTTFDFGLGFFY